LTDFPSVDNLLPLASQSGLNYLRLINFREINDLSPLSSLTGLTILHLHYIPGVTELSSLTPLTQLTELSIIGCTNITDYSSLASLTNLVYLEIETSDDYSTFNNNDLDSLAILCPPANLPLEDLLSLKQLIVNGVVYTLDSNGIYVEQTG